MSYITLKSAEPPLVDEKSRSSSLLAQSSTAAAPMATKQGSTESLNQEEKAGFGFGFRKKVSVNSKMLQSSFVSQIVPHSSLARFLTYRPAETSYLFFNIGRSFIWADYSCQIKDPLSIIHFKDAYVTCHDVNRLTRENLDTVMGFNTGDVMFYSPISGKYFRLNKQGLVNKTAVTCIKWLPGSENLFMAGFEDGHIVIFDKEKEDHAFTIMMDKSDTNFRIYKPPKSQKVNPISVWHVSSRPITAISFSPDCVHVAVTSMDGCLRIIDHVSEKLWDVYHSFFGGLLCACWSPDGKFILTGGQDDLVTVWSFRGKVVARCQGHSSWVTSVAFDAYNCTERSYRFGSVSEDSKLCLWEFSISSLHRPKMHGTMRKSRAGEEKPGLCIDHPALSKNEVSLLEPFMCRSIHNHPLCCVSFQEDAMISTDRQGVIKIWSRPK